MRAWKMLLSVPPQVAYTINSGDGLMRAWKMLLSVAALGALMVTLSGPGAYGAIQEAEDRMASGLQRAAAVAYYPSLDQMWVKLSFDRRTVRFREVVDLAERIEQVQVQVIDEGDGQTVASTTIEPVAGSEQETRLDLPPLEGRYEIRFTFLTGEDSGYRISQELVRERFAWEGNTLGISDDVPRPFRPVAVSGREVGVVLRDYQMNGYGLFDAVTADGRELLASPMTLQYELADGTRGELEAGRVKLVEQAAKAAVFEAEAESPAVKVRTRTSVAFDGVAKVRMTLHPGEQAATVSRLWVDIPVRDDEAPLMHTYVDRNRVNHAGYTPAGEGVVWTGSDSLRNTSWQNDFCAYVWVGSEGPGLAWFGENDLGYLTEKGGSKTPIQELRREGDVLTLRVYLVNKASVIEEPTTLVFGLQATPTKPMPKDWRTVEVQKMSGPVVPWGGLTCSYKFPYQDDWSVVDKIIEGRLTGEVDWEWFEQWAEANDPPLIHGRGKWLDYQEHFVRRAVDANRRPLLTYHEEMRASTLRPEWAAFASEWGGELYTDRAVTSMDMMRRGFNNNPSNRVTFPDSYIDYGVYYANEWLKRGVGLYWDNTYPQLSLDTRMTAAYETESGDIQPATVIWQQREYQQRTWNLLVHWQDRHDQPLQWSTHTTNTLLAPVHTYATTFLDLEWGRLEPFEPELIRTEMIGRQVGSIPTALYELYGRNNVAVIDLPREQQRRIRWAMEAVHEVRAEESQGALTPAGVPVREAFGYGSADVKVHNYWARQPAAEASNDDVQWLLLERPGDQAVMVILVNWSEDDAQTTFRLNSNVLSLPVGEGYRDAETGEPLPTSGDGEVTVDLPGPFGSRVITLGQWDDYEGEINREGFIHWPE